MGYTKTLPPVKSYSKDELRALALNPYLNTDDAEAMAKAKRYDKNKFLKALHQVCDENKALARTTIINAKVLPAPVVKLLLQKICV